MPEEILDFAPEPIQFWVPGLPAPGGSKKYVGHSAAGRPLIVDDAGQRNKNWRAVVSWHGWNSFGTVRPLLTGPLHVRFEFTMPRPGHHFGSKKGVKHLKANAPTYHTVKPDAIKLARSTEDALTGVIYADDAATCSLESHKRYGDKPGCLVTITQL